MFDDWQEQERREEEERQWAEQEYIELHRDEPSPFCPECEWHNSKCDCMVYGRKLFPTKREPYDWQTRRKPLHNEDHIEIMKFKDWCSDKGSEWRENNCIKYKTIKTGEKKLSSGEIVEEWEIVEDEQSKV
tara:strand:+ start:859 stop:1251 length:393 start_codon:yes stop_codon:yes gene_type:complete